MDSIEVALKQVLETNPEVLPTAISPISPDVIIKIDLEQQYSLP